MVFNLFSPFGPPRNERDESDANARASAPVAPDPRNDGIPRAPGRWTPDMPLVGDAVGWRERNARGDVEEVARTLHETGDLDTDRTGGPTGFFGGRMDEGIKTAQKRNGLRPDGIITPDGPTDRALRDEKRQQRDPFETPPAQRLRDRFGDSPSRDDSDFGFKPQDRGQSQRQTDPVMPFAKREQPEHGTEPEVPLPRAKPTDIGKAFQQRERQQRNRSNASSRHDDPVMPFAERKDRGDPADTRTTSPRANAAELPQTDQNPEFRRPDGSKAPDLLALPDAKNQVIDRDNWRIFQRAADQEPDISRRRRDIYATIFAWEGGAQKHPESTAYGGILQPTLDGLRDQGRLQGIPPNARPQDLAVEDLPKVYDAYFDDSFKGLGGSNVLDDIPDEDVATAIGDTLFRHPYKKSRTAIQRAVNKVADEKIEVDGIFGSGTLKQVNNISKDTKKRRRFLNALSEARKEIVNKPEEDLGGDRMRFNYFGSRKRGVNGSRR